VTRRQLYLLVIALASVGMFLCEWARDWAVEKMKENRDE
jgi:hypothetical protein